MVSLYPCTLVTLLPFIKIINHLSGTVDIKKSSLGTTSSAGYGSAFLGPNLWERPSGDNDFDLEYMDLDEFLSENGIPVDLDDMVQDAVSIGLGLA